MPALKFAVGAAVASVAGWKLSEYLNEKNDNDTEDQADNPVKENDLPKGNKSAKENNKRHNPDQEALNHYANLHHRLFLEGRDIEHDENMKAYEIWKIM